MNISKINANITSPNFYGHKQAESLNEKKHQTVPVLINIPSEKLTKALKAAVLIPAAALPLIAGSCDDKDCCDEYWADGKGTSINSSIHILPECTIGSISFANDTVKIPSQLSDNSKLNRTMNKFIDALNIPRQNSGNFPARLAFKTPDYIQNMTLEGEKSDNNNYFYNVLRIDNNGALNILKYEFSLNGDDLVMKCHMSDKSEQYKFSVDGDTVNCYQYKSGKFVKDAVFYPSDDKNYSIIKVKEDGDTTRFSDINLFCVEPDFKN